MPPRPIVGREDIISAALDIIRKNDIGAVNARALAAELHCSTQPIFTNFASMDEVKSAAATRAGEIYTERLNDALKDTSYPPYKASGMNYIRFAAEEPALFRLLFMRDRSGEYISEAATYPAILDLAAKSASISPAAAEKMHLEIWLFCHGIAAMIATSYMKFDTETVSEMLSDEYHSLSTFYFAKDEQPSGPAGH